RSIGIGHRLTQPSSSRSSSRCWHVWAVPSFAVPAYVPPLRDIRFVLANVVDLPGLSDLEAYRHADPETCFGLIDEAGRFLAEVFGPLNTVGDRVGSVLDAAGNVVTPPGFRDAYRRYVDAGWGAV